MTLPENHLHKVKRIKKAKEIALAKIGNKKAEDYTEADMRKFLEYLAVKEGVAIDTTEDVIKKEAFILKS